jgi:hypothetical protein
MKSELRKYGLIGYERSGQEVHVWNRITLFQWITQIFTWIFVIKAIVTVFVIDDDSEWIYYLGDISPVIGKQINQDFIELINS